MYFFLIKCMEIWARKCQRGDMFLYASDEDKEHLAQLGALG